MEERFNTKNDEINLKLSYLMQSGDIKEFIHVINDGMLQFISSSSSLINSPLETYERVTQDKPEITATHINFYFVTENGI